jgi:outer membrane protein OmpA-like peptidoglycan-associated protein
MLLLRLAGISVVLLVLAAPRASAASKPSPAPTPITPKPGTVQMAPGAEKNPPKDAPTGGGPPIKVAPGGAPAPAPHRDPAVDAPGKGTWNSYDFIPGDRTIWFEDFTSDAVGQRPKRMAKTDEGLEVVAIRGRRYLRTIDGGSVTITLPEALPERFTVEVVYHSPQNDDPLVFDTREDGKADDCTFGCYMRSAFVECGPRRSLAGMSIPDTSGFVNGRFIIDGRTIKAYLNERRLANLPGATVARAKTVRIRIPGNGRVDDPTLVTGIRIAEIGKKLYDTLAERGRVAARGLLFDPGSDRLRPESTPTLKEIAAMLEGHPDLKLSIEAHTDEAGQADADLELSRRRADALKSYLTAHGLAAGRLETKGYGSSKPAASTDTPEGRLDNRRVELVKI